MDTDFPNQLTCGSDSDTSRPCCCTTELYRAARAAPMSACCVRKASPLMDLLKRR
jgi:hypothetical protein